MSFMIFIDINNRPCLVVFFSYSLAIEFATCASPSKKKHMNSKNYEEMAKSLI